MAIDAASAGKLPPMLQETLVVPKEGFNGGALRVVYLQSENAIYGGGGCGLQRNRTRSQHNRRAAGFAPPRTWGRH